MTRRMTALALALLLGVMTLAPFAAVKAAPTVAAGGLTVPVTGTGSGSSFKGTLTINKFSSTKNQLLANGTLVGTLTNTATGAVSNVVTQVAIPVANITGTCEILHLELGPIDLTLLGLVVHVDKIVIDITAQQGGGLLGDLLCAIANLLNGGSLNNILGQLVLLLNQLLGALNL